MLKTRNIFVLKGTESDVNSVLGNLQFKGLTELTSSKISIEDIKTQFSNNKSVVCSNVPEDIGIRTIEINVINSNSVSNTNNCINIASGNISDQFESIVLSLDCDIGDHKSNSSGLSGTPSKKDCPYCIEFTTNRSVVSKEFDSPNKIVYASNNFVILPTVGEFIKGYLLIIPREHVMSLSELSSELREEFLEVLDDITFLLKLTYPIDDVLVWENGTGNGGIGKSKSSIVHAHVHIAPSKLTAEKIRDFSGFSLTKISYKDLSLYGKHSYLLVKGNSNDEWFINDNPDLYIPRQYVRQLIAEEYGFSGDIWNWRTNPFYYLISATHHDIQHTLVNNWFSLPDRIKKYTKNFLV